MQQCNGSGVEVVTLLSAGRDCNVEELAVCQDAALGSIQTKGRKNLDSLAGCGIIGCEHLFHFRNRLVAAGRFRFCIGPLTPTSPRWKTKTGAAMGKSQDSARFDLGIFSCVLCFESLLYQNGTVENAYDLPIHATVSVGLMMI